MKAVCMSCSEEFEVKAFEENAEHVCLDCKDPVIPIGDKLMYKCANCGRIYESIDKYPICKLCAKDCTVGVSNFSNQLMSAMRPLTRQIDNLCYNNELLDEILATLSITQNDVLKELVKMWNQKKRKIKED